LQVVVEEAVAQVLEELEELVVVVQEVLLVLLA
jgi:hypothetical protein